jgi:hypothetical protein
VGAGEGGDLVAGIGSAIIGTDVIGSVGETYTSRYKWLLMVDWGGVETDESARLMGVSTERGLEKYTNGSGDGLADIGPGRLSLTLNNDDRRFDPRNASSPLYPNVTNLTSIKLLVINTEDFSQEPVFAGTIDDIRPDSGGKTVTITASDDLELLRQQTATTPMIFNTTADAAIRSIAEAAGIDDGIYQASTHPLTVFAVENVNALQAICDITEASLGQVFVDRRGKLRYYSLSYTGMVTHNLNEDNVDKTIAQGQPWDERYPSCAVYANRWARTATKTLWDYGRSLSIPAGSSVTVKAEWSNIGTPGALVYGRNAYLSAPGVLTNALTATISNITPRSCDITVSNVSPWAQGTKLQLRGVEYVSGLIFSERRYQPGQKISGRLATQASTKELFSAEDTALPAKRRNKFVLDSQFVQDGNYASAYAALLKDHLKNGLSTVTVTFESAASFAQQFGTELFNLVELDFPTLGINGDDYYLGKVRHEWHAPEVGKIRTSMTFVQLLKSAVSITPEPILDLPEELEPDPNEDGDGNPLLPPPSGDGCPSDAPTTGPFALPGPNVLYSYGPNRFGVYRMPSVVRNNVHTYRTLIQFTPRVETTSDNGRTWQTTNGILNYTVTARDGGGQILATSANIGPGQYRFEIPANVTADNYVIEVEEGAGVYATGSVITSGSVAANSTTGVTGSSSLLAGSYYALTATSEWGQSNLDPGYYQAAVQFNDDGSWHGTRYNTGARVLAVEYLGLVSGPSGGQYTRHYFQAASTSVQVRADDDPHSDNTGDADFDISDAIVTGTNRVTLSGLTIRNICPIG